MLRTGVSLDRTTLYSNKHAVVPLLVVQHRIKGYNGMDLFMGSANVIIINL